MTEKVYIGTVTKIFERSGPGGPISYCLLELEEEKRMLHRAIIGPVQVGYRIALLDCDRERKRSR